MLTNKIFTVFEAYYPNITQIYPNFCWPKITLNDPKWFKMTQNDSKWPKMTQNYSKLPKMTWMTQNDQKKLDLEWPKMMMPKNFFNGDHDCYRIWTLLGLVFSDFTSAALDLKIFSCYFSCGSSNICFKNSIFYLSALKYVLLKLFCHKNVFQTL